MNGLGVLCIIFTLIQLSFAETSTQKGQRISNVVAIVGRHFTYALPEDSNSRSAKYMVTEEGKKSLPKWLSFDREKNLLFGVPSWRDKGTYHLQIQSTDTFTLYVKDLHDVASDMKLRNSNVTKIPTIREIVCHSMLPVAAATIIFDLHAGKLGGKERSELLKRVAAFADVHVESLHMSLGKGHSTALNLKDVMMLTAGPGNVHEAKEPGVVISWQIGCGIDVAGTRTASLLKSSAETGAFAKALSSPVSGWHITTGFPKGPRRRARRQVIMKLYPTPTPSRKGPIPAGKVPGITATPLVTATPPSSVSRKVTVIIPTPTTTVPTRTVFPNTHPVVKAQFNPIVLYSGQVLRFSIPSNTFYDAEDGNTRVLTVKMYSISGATLGSSSWILLNDHSQEIYGLGLDGRIGAHQFLVSAVDSGGLSVQAPIMIQIQKDLHQYNHEFSLDMNMDYSLFSNNVELRVELLDLMATYFGVSSADIRAVSFSQAAGGGSGVNFKFHFAHVPNLPCDGTVIRGLIGKFGESSVSPKLVSTLGSKYAVRKGSYKLMGDCVNKPEVRNAIGEISALAGQAFDYTVPADVFFDVEDGYNLDLALRTEGLAQVPPMSWVLFNKNERTIYGLPMDDMITSHRYTLYATDSDDNFAMDTFSLNVGADSNRYNHEFTIVLDTDNVQFINSVDKRLALIKEIASYFQTDIKNVRVVNYGAGVSFTFRFSDVPYNDCKGRLKTLIDLFGKDEGQVNPAFKRALSFTITKGMYKLLGPCRVDVEPPQCNKRISIPYDVFAGQVFEYMIPADTCVDGIDGDMSKLDLKMTAIGGIDLASNSWILLDGPALRIFGLPMDSHSGDHEFDLTVKDSSGLPAKETFKIPVKKDMNPYNHIFNIVFEADRSKFENNVGVRIDFVKKLAAYFGVDPSKLRIASITPGSGPKEINLGFHIAGIPEKSCDGSELMKAINSFGMKSLTASFISSLAPDFVVKSGDYELLRECAQNNKPEVGQGVVPGDIPITTMGGQVKYYTIPANAFFDPEDGDTRKLTIRLLGPDGKPLPVDSWVRLNTDKQEIQALPMGSEVGPNTFIIEAVDSKGGKVNDTITIQVNEEPRNYTHQFTLMLNYDGKDNKFLEDVKERLDLIDLLADHFKVKKEDVRVISSGKGVKFSFYLSNIPDKPCNHPMRTEAVNSFGRNGRISRILRRALEKRFKPTKAFAEDIGKCSALGNIPPVVNRPLRTLTMDVGEPFIFKVPYDTFLDKNEINTRYLTLDLKNVDGSSLPSKKSWITLLDTQEIYALPQEPGTYTYILTASDRKNTAQDVFNIVVKKPTKPTTEFIMYLRTPKKPFMNDVKVPVKLAKKLADFLGVPVGTINILSYKPDGSTINFKFGLTNVPQEPCDHPMTVEYVKRFGANKASSGLKQAIHRYFNIKSAKVEQVGPCAPKPFNTPPDILNHVDRLDLFAHQGLRYVVPVDAYYDKEDGTTRELVLSLRLEGRKDQVLLPTSWILMNSTSQEIYALPMPEFSGLHNFAIEAKDSGGKTIYDAVEVLVKEDNTPFNHKFTIFLDNDNATFLNNVGVRLGLVQKLADYFGVNLTNIRVDEYGPGPYMTFHLDNIPYGDCSSVYFDKFGSDKVNTDLKTALQPEYRVVDGSYITTEPCSGVVSGVVATPNAARGLWWSATLIPIIVVGIVLLILGLCLLFVLRRKKKRGLSADDAKTFIYKRKPVVFKEEYDVKEDLLKQPLVVPNEKPPLPPPAYPRTPNGSAVTTPMDERRAYQAPSFTSSRQMNASSNGSAMASSGGSAGGAAMAGGGGGSGSVGAGGGGAGGGGMSAGGGSMSAGGGSMSAGGAAMGAGAGGEGGSMGGGGGGMGGGGGGIGGGGMGGGGAGGGGAGGGSAGGGAGGAAMSGGGAMNSSKSSSYSYNSNNQSGSARKGAYSGYRLPPAYVPP